MPRERPAHVLTTNSFDTTNENESVRGGLRTLESSNHIVTHAESIHIRNTLSDNTIAVDEVRIPEAVPFGGNVVFVTSARIQVKSTSTRLALRDTTNDLPEASTVPVTFVLVDEGVGAELTTTNITETSIIIPFADIGEETTSLGILVEFTVVESTSVVVGKPAAADFRAAGSFVTIETTTRTDVSVTIFVVRRPVAPTTKLTPVAIDGSRGNHIHPVMIRLHLEPVTASFLVLRESPSFGGDDLGVGVLLLPGRIDVRRSDLTGGRLRSGVTRSPAAEGTVEAGNLAGSHGGEGGIRAVDGRTILTEAGIQEGVPGRRDGTEVGVLVAVPGREEPRRIVRTDGSSVAVLSVEFETTATIIGSLVGTTEPTPVVLV